MAISYLNNNNESDNIDTSIQTGVSESVNDEDNSNEEVSYSDEENIGKTILIEEINKINNFTEEEKQGIDEVKQMINIFINNQDFINDISSNFELVASYNTDDEFLIINVETAKEFLNEVLPHYKDQMDILKKLVS